MKLEYAIFYASYYEAIKELPPEQQAKIYNAIFQYCFEGIEPSFLGTGKIIWTLIKPQIDANIKNYENGKKGGRPPKKEEKKPPFINKKNPPFEKTETKSKSKSKKKSKNNTENFELFWNEYPRKISKGEAEKKFLKLDIETQQKCIEAVKAQIKWREKQPEGTFVPEWKHPTTWINQGCWNDELETKETKKLSASDIYGKL